MKQIPASALAPAHASTHVTIVEVGGQGGVFQHSLALAEILTAHGVANDLLTATDPEETGSRVSVRAVFDWARGAERFRNLRVLRSFLFDVIPQATRNKGVVWVQGSFKPPLTLLLLVALKVRGLRVLYSPHNLFDRKSGAIRAAIYRACFRMCEKLVVYNRADFTDCERRGIAVVQAPLVMHAPRLDPNAVERWRLIVKNAQISVCLVGQIRPEKNIAMLVKAAALANKKVLIAGADAGGLEAVEAAMDANGNPGIIDCRYLDLRDFAAILAVVGTVALPYSVASQSGVAELAHQYGCHVVGAAVGGLADQVDEAVPELTAESLGRVLRAQPDRTRLRGELGFDSSYSQEDVRTILELVRQVGDSGFAR